MIAIKKLSERRAISPVIATVILVAVAITVAVAVSYWMSSIAGQYTGFEKVEIQSGYATKIEGGEIIPGDPDAVPPIPSVSGTGWKITIKLKNTGSAPSTIITCFVNEKPIEEYLYATTKHAIALGTLGLSGEEPFPPDGVTLESGTSATILVNIVKTDSTTPTGVTFTSGTTINVKLHSTGGMDYIRLITLS